MKSFLIIALSLSCMAQSQAQPREPQKSINAKPAQPPRGDFAPPGAPAPSNPPHAAGGGGSGSGGGAFGRVDGAPGGTGGDHRAANAGPFEGRHAIAMPPFFPEQTRRTLVVPSGKMDATAIDTLREDLNIMSHILEKSVEKALDGSTDRRMGITVFTLPGTRGENIYLDDYGAIFLLNVSIPLSSSDTAEGKKAEKEDSDWEQTKRELYGNRPADPVRYDAKKVEGLKSEIIKALKNALNIRGLKADQMITVIVAGGQANIHEMRVVTRRDGDKKENKEVFERRVQSPRNSVLTLRVKKADADAFASGKLSLEEFERKTNIGNH